MSREALPLRLLRAGRSPSPVGSRFALKKLLPVVITLLAVCGLRFVHLEADVPRHLTTWSVGVFVDEGYKTLDARNSVLFGEPSWHENDDYPGWVNRSPITYWLYRTAFERLGPDLASGRIVSVACFTFMLAWFAVALRKRYETHWLVLGVLLLGTGHTLFFFSRIALFEPPLILCLYGVLFLLAMLERPISIRSAAAFAVVFAIATFGIKRSAPVYFIPVALGMLVASRVSSARKSKPLAFVATLAAVGVIGILTLWVMGAREVHDLKLENRTLADVASSLFTSTFMHSSSALVALGVGLAFHALLVAPRQYLGDPYRASLLALILLGPPTISLFEYRPLRYYVPFTPAYVLFALEWLHLGTWRESASRAWTKLTAIPLFLIFGWFAACFAIAVYRYFVLPVFLPGWHLPNDAPRWLIAVGAVLLGGVFAWQCRGLVQSKNARIAGWVLILGASARDLAVLVPFFAQPPKQHEAISTFIRENIPEGRSIAGDWAPMLTLGTRAPSLYMSPKVNRPARIQILQPDYLMVIGSWDVLRMIRKQRSVHIGDPIFESHYAGRVVSLYPLEYIPLSELPPLERPVRPPRKKPKREPRPPQPEPAEMQGPGLEPLPIYDHPRPPRRQRARTTQEGRDGSRP